MKTYRVSSKMFTVFILIFCVSFIAPLDMNGQALNADMLKNLNYRAIGPTRQGGRYVDFAVVEKQSHIFYAATASGGLWKTVNNGITYEPVFDYESVFSIGDVAVSQTNPDIVWVGTGEANNSRSCYWGDGVYKSTDAGKTWKNMGLKESHHVGRIVIHPKNPDIVYVAALGHLFSDNPERGLYKTTDGGNTWEKSLEVIDHEKYIGVVDVAMDPSNSDVLYAASFDKVRKPYTYNLGGPGSGIYKTTDAGKSWEKLGNGLPTGMLGKIGVDVYLRDSNIVYAVIENANKPGMSAEERYKELLNDQSSGGIYGNQVYRSDDAGKSWKMVSPEGYVVGGGTPYYYQQIRIDPNNPDHVYNLSTRVDHSTDGGKTWEQAFRFGGDNHALWIDPANSDHLLLGYDHGMGVTYDAGENWYHPDNIPLAQFYAIGVDMDYPYNVYGGTQDNGSIKGPNTKRDGGPIQFEDWSRVGGGDGFYNVVDPTDSRWLYNESQFGNISRLDQKTGERVGIRPPDPVLRFNWNAPILISPHNPKVIFFGTNKLFRSDNRGDTWVDVSPDLSTNDPKKLTTGKGGDGNIQYCTITTIDESPVKPGLLWAGTDDGNVHVSKDGGGNWIKLNDRITGNPGYWVSRVTASNHNPGTAYVSYTGYRRDDFRPFIFKTADFGQTWTSIAANLPNEPINVVKEDRINPNLLYVGTEFAVYISIDSGKSWVKMKNNMPTQPVQDLLIHPRENDLVIGTHGRGFFITDITPLQELTAEVIAKDAYLFNVESKIRWIDNNMKVYSSSNYDGESEPLGITVYYYLKNKASNKATVRVSKGNVVINEMEGSVEPGINTVLWDMTWRKERTAEEKKEAQAQIERAAQRGRASNIDPDYILIPAPLGDYKITLTVGGQTFTRTVSIIQDLWY